MILEENPRSSSCVQQDDSGIVQSQVSDIPIPSRDSCLDIHEDFIPILSKSDEASSPHQNPLAICMS